MIVTAICTYLSNALFSSEQFLRLKIICGLEQKIVEKKKKE